MKLGPDEKKQVATDIQNAFSGSHEILFVGRGGSDDEIKQICDMPWSCVLTSRTDAAFSGLFSNEERHPIECKANSISVNILSRQKMPILRILGIDDDENNHTAQMRELGYLESEEREINQDFLNIIPGMLDCVNLMLVIGYDPENSEEVRPRVLVSALLKVMDGSVMFFEGNGKLDSGLLKLAEKKNFLVYEESLTEVMDSMDEENEEGEDFFELEQDNIFFREKTMVSVSDQDLRRSSHFATLLKEQDVHRIQLQGKTSKQIAFDNFLKYSSSEIPQWYGYQEKSRFYLDRPFYKPLYTLTKHLLNGTGVAGVQKNCKTIILEGDPGSSKSIMLGKLAYEIYEEHEYPVIYIKNDNLVFYSESEELQELNLLMKAVSNAGDSKSKILLIWDCSSHRNVEENAKNLVRLLDNLGRRFVLICSAYVHSRSSEDDGILMKDGNKFYYNDDCCYVRSDRNIDEAEKTRLKQMFEDYSGIEPENLNRLWEWLESEAQNDIFTYFYMMIALLQEPLRSRLTREQRIVGVYVQKQLKLILEGYEKENSGFGNLFERAGIDVQNLNLPEQGAAAEEENMENEGEIASEEALRKFNVCIAIFSKFKISTPYSLASKMLTGEDSDTVIYSSDKRKLFQLLTTQIPWIHYGCQNEEEDFKFSFRNTLEANIFLEKNKVTPEEQVDMICEFIRLYGKEYQKNKYIDEELKKGLRQLLRMVGPNTNYPDYAKDGKEKDVYREILRELNRMIEELKNLRETYGVPDEDGSLVILEVSFMREYYGWKWDEVSGYNDTYRESGDKRWSVLLDYYSPKNYLERLGNLKRAIDIAVEKLKEIERRLINCNNFRDRRNLIDRRNSLTNEMVLCNLVAQEIHGQYKECCEELSTEVNKEWQELRFTLPYRDVFERMQEVIDSNPTNGYYYNTIMKAFLKEYNRSNIPKRSQMECLSEINLLIDPIDTGEIPNITNRGYGEYDELDKHILEIRQLASDYKVTIDDLDHKKCNFEDFYQMYDTMQEVNNPSAILFVCRQELSAENILKQHEALLPEQRKICTKVADFMQRDENMRCIERKPAAMAMLIRVVWMESSGFPLSNLKEANLPAMPVDKWKNLMSLCEQYEEIAKEAKKPSIMLIYALSVLQVTGSYGKCMAVLKRIGDKNFYSSYRMRVPYIYCNEQKEPQLYSGEIQKIDGNRGEILLHVSEKNVMAKFDLRNLTSKLMKNPPAIHTVLNGLELGLGYTGFSLYMEEGRKAKAGV